MVRPLPGLDVPISNGPVTQTWYEWFQSLKPGRGTLLSARTYYVRPDGDDRNSGLANTSGGAFLTIQKAINTVIPLDLGGFNVTIQVAAGTYSAGGTLNVPIIGGILTITGDPTTPANVIISTTGGANCFLALNNGVYLQVQGFKLQTAGGGVGVYASTSATLQVVGTMDFGVCTGGTHYAAAFDGTVGTANGTAITISGGANFHVLSAGGSKVFNNLNTVTVTGTPAFSSDFISITDNSFASYLNTTFSGAATGTRYSATNGGGINTGGGGANFFPGNAAGAAIAPGWYA
jgi:hypothetical protein